MIDITDYIVGTPLTENTQQAFTCYVKRICGILQNDSKQIEWHALYKVHPVLTHYNRKYNVAYLVSKYKKVARIWWYNISRHTPTKMYINKNTVRKPSLMKLCGTGVQLRGRNRQHIKCHTNQFSHITNGKEHWDKHAIYHLSFLTIYIGWWSFFPIWLGCRDCIH